MHPDDLERLVHEELRQLPLPRAPLTLLPRVMAAVRALANRPWYERPWFSWPVGWQIASTAALIAGVVAAFAVVAVIQLLAAGQAPALLGENTGKITIFLQRTETAVAAMQALWRTVLQPITPYAFALVATMSLACAALGAALNQVILGKGLHQ
jgi:hypothetical protein